MAHLSRWFRHFLMTHWRVRKVFSAQTLNAIESTIASAEQTHGGEIRFAVEGELSNLDLWRNLSPRARAVQVFGTLGVWDTEHNNGVLIYVLMADRAVEIVADRGYRGKVSDSEWIAVCSAIEQAFRSGDFERGSVEGVVATSKLIAQYFPTADHNELPNRPTLL